jgi:hypothetical protein
VNLYRYVGNSPTNATDPSGLVDPGTGLVVGVALGEGGLALLPLLGAAGVVVVGGLGLYWWLNRPRPPSGPNPMPNPLIDNHHLGVPPARHLVSERCGGNPIDWGRGGR